MSYDQYLFFMDGGPFDKEILTGPDDTDWIYLETPEHDGVVAYERADDGRLYSYRPGIAGE